MDCQLAEIDGFEATKRIRAREAEAAIAHAVPIVALTASATKGDLERCFAAGMSDHVSKPVDARRLLAVIARHLQGNAPPPRPAQPEPSRAAVADLARALERLAGDRALLRKIAVQFADGAPDARAKLRAAVDGRNAGAVTFAAHRLRGQAASFGGEALMAAAAALEDAGRRENWTAAAASLLNVEGELDQLLRALAAQRTDV